APRGPATPLDCSQEPLRSSPSPHPATSLAEGFTRLAEVGRDSTARPHRSKRVPAAEDNRPLDDILQLANIPGPGVSRGMPRSSRAGTQIVPARSASRTFSSLGAGSPFAGETTVTMGGGLAADWLVAATGLGAPDGSNRTSRPAAGGLDHASRPMGD